MKVTGNIVDLADGRIYPGVIEVKGDRIVAVTPEPKKTFKTYIIPGFIDAHVHVESSMLVPSEFARLAVRCGTVACVSDPHEIANVLGMDGIRFMIENGADVPFRFFFGAPSCVPATPFETSGGRIGRAEIEALLSRDDIKYMSEMMNYPGVINGDPEVMDKIAIAKSHKKPIDGHAPGLRGDALRKYAAAGISTDHECFEYDEAVEKIERGMKILIREGSAARNFETLAPLISRYPEMVMFASDDLHPQELVNGHINLLAKRAIKLGHDPMIVLRCACLNPSVHYGFDVCRFRPGDRADFVVVSDLSELEVIEVYLGGELVAKDGQSLLPHAACESPNKFRARKKAPEDFKVKAAGASINVIEAVDGQLVTGRFVEGAKIENGCAVADVSRGVLKIAVVNRYEDKPPAVAFIRGFGLAKGALASSVAHDSHNIIAVGASDDAIARAVNHIVRNQGGLSVVGDDFEEVLPLPIAGLMTNSDGESVAADYRKLESKAKSLGSRLRSPLMTLSFMALLVIPSLKLSDRGLFDGEKFEFTGLFV